MSQSAAPRITVDTARQLALASGIRPDDAAFEEYAKTLGIMFAAIDRTEELNLAEHEPCTTLRLSGGPTDAEL